MDVDLRRPSLGEVFSDDGTKKGLTEVLRGMLPWQRTVVQTDTPNLDYLPTGNARDIPIEILGTLELRQLLIGLSNHYDRVILDGPAVLGMADCRMLGRIVDAAVLVVRSGSHELRPLQRAKAMLEQSHVVLAGVVFNGLKEDYQNWSSYGPDNVYGADGVPSRYSGRAGSLGAPSDEPAALAMAGGPRRLRRPEHLMFIRHRLLIGKTRPDRASPSCSSHWSQGTILLAFGGSNASGGDLPPSRSC